MSPRIATARTCGSCGAETVALKHACPLCGHDPRLEPAAAVIARTVPHGPAALALAADVLAVLDTLGDES